MFLTAAAQNLLCMKLAAELGVVIASPWLTWFKAAFVPAMIGLAITPLILYKLSPPEITQTPEAPAAAAEKLIQMGPMSRDEKLMMGTMAFALVLWVCFALGRPSAHEVIQLAILAFVNGDISPYKHKATGLQAPRSPSRMVVHSKITVQISDTFRRASLYVAHDSC